MIRRESKKQEIIFLNSYESYGVGDSVDQTDILGVEKRIEKIEAHLYREKKKFRDMFPESKFHKLTEREHRKYGDPKDFKF